MTPATPKKRVRKAPTMSRQEYLERIRAETWNPARLLARLESRRRITDAGCWEYTGKLTKGYAYMGVGDSHRYAHRLAYELLVGPIPDGTELDHLCRNTACFNPEHLEPVSHYENMRRSEHPTYITHRTGICQRGHSMEDAYVRPDRGTRMCRSCLRLSAQRRRAA